MARLTPDRPYLHPDVEHQNCNFGRFCEIGKGSRLQNVYFDDYSYCDRYADISNAHIVKFSNIASFVRIVATDHPMEEQACIILYRSPVTLMMQRLIVWLKSAHLVILDDTWIGHNAQIKPEVTLGHGAIVASGAIVTKDVAPLQLLQAFQQHQSAHGSPMSWLKG